MRDGAMPEWLDMAEDVRGAWGALAARLAPLSERRALDAAFAAQQWAWLALLRRAQATWPGDADLRRAIGEAEAALRDTVADLDLLPPRRLKQVGRAGEDVELARLFTTRSTHPHTDKEDVMPKSSVNPHVQRPTPGAYVPTNTTPQDPPPGGGTTIANPNQPHGAQAPPRREDSDDNG